MRRIIEFIFIAMSIITLAVSSIFYSNKYFTTKQKLDDTYAAINILSMWQLQSEGVIKFDTPITTTDVIWAKSVLNTVGAEQGLPDLGTSTQPCY